MEDNKEYNLFIEEDTFYKENLYSNYGEVATNLKSFLERVSQNQKTKVKIENFDDMQQALNSMPELRKESGNASKHVDLTSKLTREINVRQLLRISMLEQDIVTKDNKTGDYEQLVQVFRDPQVKFFDKVRLMCIFALRWEGDSKIYDLKRELRMYQQNHPTEDADLGVDSDDLIDQLLDYGGQKRRGSKLFNMGFMEKAKKMMGQAFDNVPNVYARHVPHFITIIDEMLKGKNKDETYPTIIPMDSSSKMQFTGADSINCVVLYIIGGATFSELNGMNDLR